MTLPALALAVLTFLLVACAVVVLYLMTVYRGLSALKRDVDRSFSSLGSQLQERFETSGELMEACRGLIPRDSREMRDVAQIRSLWAIATSKEERLKCAADSELALNNLIAAARAHPDLRSMEYYLRVEKRLISLDQQVAERREKYNSAIGLFNGRLQQIPARWMAGSSGFTSQPHFAPVTATRKPAFAVREDSRSQ